ncbi:MAG TPA: DHHA1 domain-containing protein, partial [Gemmatimonadales bacterium]
ADDGRRAYLDRTAFYPTSGGQPHDTGRLNGVQITDVVDEGERIAHLLAQPITGAEAVGQLDWGRRFDHMQQHSGQHLLSAVLSDLYGYATRGVHFGPESSTVDLDGPSLTPDQVGRAEDRCNEIVVENRPVEVTFEDAAGANGLRRASERTGSLRVVTIRNLDRSACGGTHVRATGEIGPILMGKVERVRKGTRVEFRCGARAVRRARADHGMLSRLASDFSAAPDELPRLINTLRGDLKEATAARQDLETKLDAYRARELYLAAVPDATGIRRVVVREERGSLEGLRGVAQAFASLPMAIFVGAVVNPPALVLATSPDSGVDAAGVLKGLVTSVGGRGGGSATLAQGTVPEKTELEVVLTSIAG